jgi:hypothetical protein
MTANLSSFLRFKKGVPVPAAPSAGEQDLAGFDVSAVQAVANAKAREMSMSSIAEGGDEEGAAAGPAFK